MFGEDAVVEELVDGGAEITQVGEVLHALLELHAQPFQKLLPLHLGYQPLRSVPRDYKDAL